MKTSMNLLLWSTHITEDDFATIEGIKATGYDGVEVPVFEGDPDHFAKIGKHLEGLGLGCSVVTVATEEANPISEDGAVREKAAEHIKWALDCGKACGADLLCGPFHQPLGVFSGDGPTDDEKKRAAEVHRKAAEYAASLGMKLAIEFLNRFECYFLTTMADAAAHVRRVNHPAFGTMYDTFHANIEEKDGPAALRAAKDEVIHFHVSENDRGTPGAGHVPFLETFQVLRQIGYDGWMTIEAFGRALPDLAAATKVWRDFFPSRENVYKEGFTFMKQTWDKAGS